MNINNGMIHNKTKPPANHIEQSAEDRPCPDFSQFLYFLFAPTLIYRDSYPMTPKVRWDIVRTNLAQVKYQYRFDYNQYGLNKLSAQMTLIELF